MAFVQKKELVQVKEDEKTKARVFRDVDKVYPLG